MTLVRPSAKVTVDGRTLSSAEAALVWAEVDLAVNGAHDAARIKVSRASQFASAAPGAGFPPNMGGKLTRPPGR